MSSESRLILLYAKRQAEELREINLRRPMFEKLLHRARVRRALVPLFPGDHFVAHMGKALPRTVLDTFGVHDAMMRGARPARVPMAVIEEIRGRMNSNGIALLESALRGA